MFKKAVFLGLFVLAACYSQPRVDTPTTNAAAHLHVDPLPALPQPLPHPDFNAIVEVESARLLKGKPGEFTLVLQNSNGTAALYRDFEKTHGKQIHVMAIDASLTDYHHIHPAPTRKDGLAIYTIPFTPAQGGDYVLFADVTPQRDHIQRFLSTDFTVAGSVAPPPQFATLLPGTITPSATVNNLVFTTEVDPLKLHAGKEAMLHITVKDEHGQLFRELEPIMQTFAHLIGFSAHREYLVHTHPTGRAVTSENARGGPNLMFHVTFPVAGYYRLFLQVQVNGKVLVVPFDVSIAP